MHLFVRHPAARMLHGHFIFRGEHELTIMLTKLKKNLSRAASVYIHFVDIDCFIS